MFCNELRRTTSSVSIDSTSSESSNASNTSNTSNKSEIYYTNNFSNNIPQYQLHDLRNEFKWDLETGTIVQNNYTLTPNSSQNSPHSSQSSLAPPMPMPLLHNNKKPHQRSASHYAADLNAYFPLYFQIQSLYAQI